MCWRWEVSLAFSSWEFAVASYLAFYRKRDQRELRYAWFLMSIGVMEALQGLLWFFALDFERDKIFGPINYGLSALSQGQSHRVETEGGVQRPNTDSHAHGEQQYGADDRSTGVASSSSITNVALSIGIWAAAWILIPWAVCDFAADEEEGTIATSANKAAQGPRSAHRSVELDSLDAIHDLPGLDGVPRVGSHNLTNHGETSAGAHGGVEVVSGENNDGGAEGPDTTTSTLSSSQLRQQYVPLYTSNGGGLMMNCTRRSWRSRESRLSSRLFAFKTYFFLQAVFVLTLMLAFNLYMTQIGKNGHQIWPCSAALHAFGETKMRNFFGKTREAASTASSGAQLDPGAGAPAASTSPTVPEDMSVWNFCTLTCLIYVAVLAAAIQPMKKRGKEATREMLVFLLAGFVTFSSSWVVFGQTLEACSVWCWSAGFYSVWFLARPYVLVIEEAASAENLPKRKSAMPISVSSISSELV
ncbi:unnamed protein product, partial [Amoebophrya sp. A120]|eukprot:GSA120T00004488001.1